MKNSKKEAIFSTFSSIDCAKIALSNYKSGPEQILIIANTFPEAFSNINGFSEKKSQLEEAVEGYNILDFNGISNTGYFKTYLLQVCNELKELVSTETIEHS